MPFVSLILKDGGRPALASGPSSRPGTTAGMEAAIEKGAAGRSRFRNAARTTREPEQHFEAAHLPSVRCLEVAAGNVVDAAANVLVLVSRPCSAGQSDGGAHGSCEREHDAQCIYASGW